MADEIPVHLAFRSRGRPSLHAHLPHRPVVAPLRHGSI